MKPIKRLFKHLNRYKQKQLDKTGKSITHEYQAKPKPIGNGLKRIDRYQRANLKHGPTKYLTQDVGIKGVSSKAIVLKITNKNPETPYEHLTFRRIDSIL